jgi:hypothetical protein
MGLNMQVTSPEEEAAVIRGGCPEASAKKTQTAKKTQKVVFYQFDWQLTELIQSGMFDDYYLAKIGSAPTKRRNNITTGRRFDYILVLPQIPFCYEDEHVRTSARANWITHLRTRLNRGGKICVL